MTTIVLSKQDWFGRIKPILIERYGLTTFLLSSRLKDSLGFVVREHHYQNLDAQYGIAARTSDIRLDFYEESGATLFRLQYIPLGNTEE